MLKKILPELKKRFLSVPIKTILIVLIIFSLGVAAGYSYFLKHGTSNTLLLNQQEDPYVSFLMEIYDKIIENYWDSISDEQLTNLYKLASEKVTGRPQDLKVKEKNLDLTSPTTGNTNPALPGTNIGSTLNLQGTTTDDLRIITDQKESDLPQHKAALIQMLEKILKDFEEIQKQEFTVNVATAVLTNLSPAGRSGLFNQKQEEELKNIVQNIDPDKNLYKDLGLEKGASKEEVEKAFEKQTEELKDDISEEAEQKRKQLSYAKETLSKDDTKERYDKAGIEPTVFTKELRPGVVYLRFLKFSPTTYDEFKKTVESLDTPDGPRAMIFDLRSNIGGAIDSLPFFLGHFIGLNQYAFEFFRKGEPTPFKTTTDRLTGLTRMRQMAILVDNQTQSSAELMASALKKYNIGVVIGTPSKGWGTVERIFQLNNQIDSSQRYSMFLVHNLTLRDDGQPIEGRGVEPNINTNNPNWENQMAFYFYAPQLINAIKEILRQPPLQ